MAIRRTYDLSDEDREEYLRYRESITPRVTNNATTHSPSWNLSTEEKNEYTMALDRLRSEANQSADDVLSRVNSFRTGITNQINNAQTNYMDSDHRKALTDMILDYEKDVMRLKSYGYDTTDALKEIGDMKNASSNLSKYYSQWTTEDDYKAYKAAYDEKQGKLTFDLDKGQKEIDTLTGVSNLLKKSSSKDMINGQLSELGYNSVNELDADIYKKKMYLNESTRLQRWQTLADAVNNPDFEEYSALGASIENPTVREAEGYANVFGNRLGSKPIENIVTYSRDNAGAIAIGESNANSFLGELKYTLMSDDEVNTYNYYLAKERAGLIEAGTAQEYLDSIEETLNQREAFKITSAIDGDGFLNSLGKLAYAVPLTMSSFGTAMQNRFDTESDYLPYTTDQIVSSMLKEELSEKSAFLGSAYDTVSTVTNMLPTIATEAFSKTLGIPIIGRILGGQVMGSTTTGATYQELLNSGVDKKTARTMAEILGQWEAWSETALGAVENVGNKFLSKTIGSKLVNSKMLSTLSAKKRGLVVGLVKTAIDWAQEGLEEVIQNFGSDGIKALFTKEYEGTSASEQAYSFVQGAISAMILNGAQAGIGAAIDVNTVKNMIAEGNIQSLIDAGKTFDAKTVAYEIASKADENTGAYELAWMLHDINANLSEQTQTDITNALVLEGMDQKDAEDITAWLTKAVFGGNLTQKQQKALNTSDVISKVFYDVIVNQNSTINQRMKGYRDAYGVQGGVTSTVLRKLSDDFAKAEMESRISDKLTPGMSQFDTMRRSFSPEMSQTNKTIDNAVKATRQGMTIGSNAVLKAVNDAKANTNEPIVASASEKEALLHESLANMGYTESTSNAIVEAFMTNPDADVTDYLLGMNEAYNYGRVGYKNIPTSSFAGDLTEKQREFAYNLGREAAEAESAKPSVSVLPSGTGRVIFDKSVTSGLKDVQKTSLSTIGRVVADITHNNVVIFESVLNDKGERVLASDINGIKAGTKAPNGMYNSTTGTVYIDLHAGNNGEGTMLYTFAHELIHWMKDRNASGFKKLADFVMSEFSDNGVPLNERILEKQKRSRMELSFDDAYEEVIADAMESMFTDGNALEKLEKLKNTDRSLWEKIRDFVRDLLDRIKKAYAGLDPQTFEGQFVRSMSDKLEQISDLFAEGIYEAGAADNSQSSSSEVTPESGSVVYSLRENERISQKSIDYYNSHKDSEISEEMFNEANRIVNKMASYMLPYLDITNNDGKRYLPEEILGKTTFRNGSYGLSVENITICFRTLAYIDFTNEIKKKIGRPLTVEESFLASQMLYDIAKEPQCLYCYVSLDRKAYDGFLLEYIRQRDDVLNKFAKLKNKSKANIDKLYNEFLDGRKDTKQMKSRFNLWINSAVDGKGLIGLKDLTTEEVRSSLKDGPMADQVNDAERYAQSASWAKKLEQYRSYNSDILNMTPAMVKKLNDHYGLRFYSFSEYTPAFIVENMQQIRDASLKGLYGLAYTKKTDFARIFAPTGMNINISVFGKMVDGKVEADTRQGADWAEVQALREQYKNVGAVFVATSYEVTRWALDQDWIDVVIPFHIVRTGANVAEFYKWTNNTASQADKDASGKNKTISPAEHHNDRATFERLIKERGLTPRFEQFWDNANYMKLVNETRLSDLESTKLMPNFTEETYKAAQKSFDAFVADGGYYGDYYNEGIDYKKAVDVVASDILAGLRANEVTYGRQDINISDQQKQYDRLRKNPSEKSHGQKNSDRAFPSDADEIAKEWFGTTSNWSETGYLTKDGSQLDFSGRHWKNHPELEIDLDDSFFNGRRDVEHFEISEAFPEYNDINDLGHRGEILNDFLNEGNIRIVGYRTIDLRKKPTEAQFKKLRDYFSRDTEYAAYVGIGNDGIHFDKSASVDDIINGIRDYFDKNVSNQSDLMRFHTMYSDRSEVELGTLFSGADTFASALDGLIHTQYAAENRPEIVSVYKMNHGGYVYEDVLDIDVDQMPDVQHLHVSPPCVDFSSMNNGKREKPIDKKLATKVAEIITKKRPRALTVENVEGYATSESMNIIRNALRKAGYKSVDIASYKDSDFGGYTNRERVVLRAMRDEELPAVKEKVGKAKGWGEAVGMDYINALPEAKTVNPRMIESLKTYNGIDPYKVTKPLLVFGESYKNKQFGHAYVDQTLPTIIAESGASRVFMPGGEVKEATPKLLARIMGLDGFKLPDQVVTARRVIGNGIPAAITQSVMGPVIESIKADNEQRAARGEQIQFSERDPNATDSRSLLSRALTSVAQSEKEKRLLESYQESISKMNDEEKRLTAIRKELSQLYSQKGQLDMPRIRELKDEATRTANRINTYDKQLLRLEATQPLKVVVDRERRLASEQAKADVKAAVRAERSKAYQNQSELMKRYRDRLHNNVVGRKQTEVKGKIRKVVSELDRLLNRGTKERNVKIGARDAVSQAINTAMVLFSDMESSDIILNGITTATPEELKLIDKYKEIYEESNKIASQMEAIQEGNDPDMKDLPDRLERNYQSMKDIERKLKDVLTRERSRLMNETVGTAIQSLADAYREIGESKKNYIALSYDPEVYNKLINLKTDLGGTTIDYMTVEQLNEVYDAYKMIAHTIRNANTLFRQNRADSVSDTALAFESEIASNNKVRSERSTLRAGLEDFQWKEFKPIYAFRHMNSKTAMSLYHDFEFAEDQWGRDVADAQSFADEVRSRYRFSDWDMQKPIKVKLSSGTYEITLEKLMSIYAYSKREQALEHMIRGGFVLNSKEAFRKVKDGKKSVLKYVSTAPTTMRVSAEDMAKISAEYLTKEQTGYVDEMQKYLTDVMGAKGNEAANILYGIDIFKEKVYFPLQSSADYVASTNQPAGQVSLKNTGMTKETVPKANNPIVLEDFDDVWGRHIGKMSTYHSFVVPIDNFNKVMNYTDFRQSDTSSSVKSVIGSVFGDAGKEYIDRFIQDLNGGTVGDSTRSPLASLIGSFKKTAVAASASVVVQQPTAILRAMSEIDPKYFVPDTSMKHADKWEQLKKYAPVAVIKEIGGFDTGAGRNAQQYLNPNKSRMEKADDILMRGAGYADEIGWNAIWDAAKRETRAKTNLDGEELLKKAGERFSEVVRLTQVYDSTLSRSGYMRSQNDIVKMATAFLGEPTTSYNMMYDAVTQAKRGTMTKGNAVKAVSATVVASVAAGILKSLIGAARKDDDDESYLNKYAQTLASNIMDDLFIPNMLPFVKDVVSIMQGWDVERTDMALVQDLYDAFNGLFKDSKSIYRKIEDFGGAVANVFGIPARNIMRDLRSLYNVIRALGDDTKPDHVLRDFGETVLNNVISTVSLGQADYGTSLNDFLDRGNTERAKEIVKDTITRKVGEGKTEAEAKASIKSSLTSHWKPIFLEAYADGDSDEMARIRKLLNSVGIYDNVVETTQTWIRNSKD